MYPTIIGLLLLPIGALLLVRHSVSAMLTFTMLCTLMSGSAAIALPALGGSSIQPAYVGLGFLILRLMMPGTTVGRYFTEALLVNGWLVIFGVYGAVTAFILPRLFAGTINVTPMKAVELDYLLDTSPLKFSSQNVTTGFYMVGSVAAAIATYMAAKYDSCARVFVRAAAWLALIHAALGIAGTVLKGTPFDLVVAFFRNASYAQLDQSFDGMVRISGIMPEASAYAGFAFTWFAFMFECWLRNVDSKWTGWGSVALGGVLIFSTSSTAYLCLALYAVIVFARQACFPGSVRLPKLLMIVAAAYLGVVVVALLLTSGNSVAQKFFRMVEHMTLDKADSPSGRQRKFWAMQGLYAFAHSWGLGIGAGSFRSSSIVTAILGSMGVVGIVSFAAYVVQTLKPLARSTFYTVGDDRLSIGIAASWTALIGLLPAAVGSPGPNPGITFGMFCGLALCLRTRFVSAHRPAPLLAARHRQA